MGYRRSFFTLSLKHVLAKGLVKLLPVEIAEDLCPIGMLASEWLERVASPLLEKKWIVCKPQTRLSSFSCQ